MFKPMLLKLCDSIAAQLATWQQWSDSGVLPHAPKFANLTDGKGSAPLSLCVGPG